MKAPSLPPDEATRLGKLDALGLLYSPAEQRFDRITSLAQSIFNVPMAMITLVGEKCQWFKSAQGLAQDETPREMSFCAHAILHPEDPFVVTDAAHNPDFADNPLVAGPPYISFYAGYPLMYQGSPVGTLCLLDTRPRQMTPAEIETLRSLAKWVENEMTVQGFSPDQANMLSDNGTDSRKPMIDPLTKLWNKQGMDELIRREFSSAQRHQQSLCAFMVEIDDLAGVVEKHGAVATDAAIKEIAARLRAAMRPADLVVRYDVNKFFVLGSDCPFYKGMQLVERINVRVNTEPVLTPDKNMDVRVTVGLASVVASQMPDPQSIIAAAEKALEKARADEGLKTGKAVK